jgi:hypothetical protein
MRPELAAAFALHLVRWSCNALQRERHTMVRLEWDWSNAYGRTELDAIPGSEPAPVPGSACSSGSADVAAVELSGRIQSVGRQISHFALNPKAANIRGAKRARESRKPSGYKSCQKWLQFGYRIFTPLGVSYISSSGSRFGYFDVFDLLFL